MKYDVAISRNDTLQSRINRDDLFGLRYVTPRQIALVLLVALPFAVVAVAYMHQTIATGRGVNWGPAIGIKILPSRLLLSMYRSDMSKKNQVSDVQVEGFADEQS